MSEMHMDYGRGYGAYGDDLGRDDGTPTGGRHPVNIGHLVMGLAFAGLVGVWAVIQADLVGDDDIRWLLPIPWVVAGAVGLLVAAMAGRRRNAPPTAAEDTDFDVFDTDLTGNDRTDTDPHEETR